MRKRLVRRCSFGVAALLCAQLFTGSAQESAANALGQLESDDADMRVAAVRALQTSLDGQIPEAMLPLLKDEGDSIRRLAARAIGSRWWQIPRERVPEFVTPLRRNARSELEDERNMAARAIGLLTRDYSGKLFARSANKRWVIYERRGAPCLIDTRNFTEELIGWNGERAAWLASAWGNSELQGAVRWHETKEMAALDMFVNRKEGAVWVWRHGSGLRRFGEDEFRKLLRETSAQFSSSGGFFAHSKSWKNDELRFEISFITNRGEAYFEHTVFVGWNAATDKLRVISHEQTKA